MEGVGAGAAYTARTAEEVFRDLCGLRAGTIRALTDDVDKFFKLGDPDSGPASQYMGSMATF